MLKISFEITDGAAFDDDRNYEIARILREIAFKVENGNAPAPNGLAVVRDINGNTIGKWSFTAV